MHQNLTFPVHPDPISGMHCWHQAVRVVAAGPQDRAGDISVDTCQGARGVRRVDEDDAPGRMVLPEGMRRPSWLMRPLKPSAETFLVGDRDRGRRHRVPDRTARTTTRTGSGGSCSGRWAPPFSPRRPATVRCMRPWTCRFRPASSTPTPSCCSAPPHGAIHLGPEGKLGGEGLDRDRRFLARTGPAGTGGRRPPRSAAHVVRRARRSRARTRRTSAAGRSCTGRGPRCSTSTSGAGPPGYLLAVTELGIASVAAWARLTEQALLREYARTRARRDAAAGSANGPAPMDMPPTLSTRRSTHWSPRSAPAWFSPTETSPSCARRVGVGLRRGERRYALRAMVEQDAPGTLGWLGAHARWWSQRCAIGAHGERPVRVVVAKGRQYRTGARDIGRGERNCCVRTGARTGGRRCRAERGRRRAGSGAAPLAR